jgi:4-amino-4-deoxy-L-arabinose transferase-like glycosyltransferase
VVGVAALLRLPGLTAAPPGLNQDEAANAWNAYCLLKTGQDQFGVRWPIFHLRALGENRSTLFCYVLLPFQALGGLSIWTTRLPAAIGGILTVLLIYWVTGRLLDRGTGLAAAALLAINPTHIQMSRLGHEGSLTPLLTLLPLAGVLWAGLPLDDRDQRPGPLRALLAGLLTGVCCYGYPAVRLFVPAFLVGAVLVSWRGWWRLARTRRGGLTLAGLMVGVGLTFGPLAYQHLAAPEQIARRGQFTRLWTETDPPSARIGKVLDRYAGHFGPDFLFRRGDADEVVWAASFGFLPWYLLPLLVVGLAVSLRRLRRSRAARVLIAGVCLYPASDCLNWHISLHALRSSAGLWPLMVLAGLGISCPLTWLIRRGLGGWSLAAGVAAVGLIAPESVRFLNSYFHDRARQLPAYRGNHVDLLEACDWLRPRLREVDAVVCTTIDMNQPYLIALVALGRDPWEWFADPREWQPAGMWDRWTRYGRFHFLDDAERVHLLGQLEGNARADRVILLLRPSQVGIGEPAVRIIGPDGKPALLIYDLRL